MKNKGFAIAGVLIILGICAVFSVYLLKMVTLEEESSVKDSSGESAYQAARAGAEYAAYQSLRLNNCSSSNISLTSLSTYNINLTCSRSTVLESGSSVTIDKWVIIACNASSCPSVASASYVERQMTIVIAN